MMEIELMLVKLSVISIYFLLLSDVPPSPRDECREKPMGAVNVDIFCVNVGLSNNFYCVVHFACFPSFTYTFVNSIVKLSSYQDNYDFT